jgi:hypothetical protein
MEFFDSITQDQPFFHAILPQGKLPKEQSEKKYKTDRTNSKMRTIPASKTVLVKKPHSQIQNERTSFKLQCQIREETHIAVAITSTIRNPTRRQTNQEFLDSLQSSPKKLSKSISLSSKLLESVTEQEIIMTNKLSIATTIPSSTSSLLENLNTSTNSLININNNNSDEMIVNNNESEANQIVSGVGPDDNNDIRNFIELIYKGILILCIIITT